MDIDNYTNGCLETWGGQQRGLRSILGLVGEAGEVAEKVKKFYRGDYDREALRQHLQKELGDVIYYWAMVCYEHGLDPSEIMEDNLTKLRDRKQRGVIFGSGDSR